MKLSRIQEKAINKIIDLYRKGESKIQFQAPTGSGKTFMAANIINEILILNEIKNIKTVIVVATISSSELPKQMESNLNEYSLFFANLKYNVELKESPSTSSVIKKDTNYYWNPENNKVFILGKSSFGKKRIFTEQGIFQDFIDEVKNNDFKLIYIRDEAHIGTKLNKEEINFEQLIHNAADFVIQMTATPNGSNKLVKISEEDLRNDDYKLLKNEAVINSDIKQDSDLLDDDKLLKIAIDKFKKVKEDYNKTVKNINPAMLIQISDKTKINTNFDANIERIKKTLTEKGLSWVKYFSNDIETSGSREKINLKSISNKNSEFDVVIFKVGPATGWNIPRACMLVQLRNVFSESLNIQTIGRIKRFPLPEEKNEEKIKVLDKYYIYSNYQEQSRSIINYELKPEYKKIKFFKGVIHNWEENTLIEKEYEENVIKYLKNQKKEIIKKSNYYKSKEILESFNTRILTDNKSKNSEVHDAEPIFDIIHLMICIEKELTNNRYFKNSIFINQINEIFDLNKIDYFIWYTILKKHIKIIKGFFKEKNKHKEVNLKYSIIEGNGLSNNRQFWIYNTDKNLIRLDKSKKNDEIVMNKNVYKEIRDYLKENENMIVLDSIPETSFFANEMRKEIEENVIEFWLRNGVRGEKTISFEYYDKELDEKHSFYPDFILKIKSGKFLVVEIKNEENKNIDNNKTFKIIETFKKYKENDKKGLIFFTLSYINTKEYFSSEHDFIDITIDDDKKTKRINGFYKIIKDILK